MTGARILRIVSGMWLHSTRALITAGVLLVASSARAYTVETVITNGCHEAITFAALRGARAATTAAAPLLPVTGDDQAMVQDLPYTAPSDMQDLGAVALVLGVRSNDLKGLSPEDLDSLAGVQSDPTTQDEHCLRDYQDLEPNGTPDAVGQCRAFILGKVSEAVTYLDADGDPTASQRVGLDVSLSLRGEVTVPLPGFYVSMGQALHALQDSFSHSYRTSDALSLSGGIASISTTSVAAMSPRAIRTFTTVWPSFSGWSGSAPSGGAWPSAR